MAPPSPKKLQKFLGSRISNVLNRKKTTSSVPQQAEATPPPKVAKRPSQDIEIERMYAAILEEMALPENKRAEMIKSESLDRKWHLILAHSFAKQKEDKQGVESKPSHWIGKVMKGELSLGQARHMHAMLRTSHKKVIPPESCTYFRFFYQMCSG